MTRPAPLRILTSGSLLAAALLAAACVTAEPPVSGPASPVATDGADVAATPDPAGSTPSAPRGSRAPLPGEQGSFPPTPQFVTRFTEGDQWDGIVRGPGTAVTTTTTALQLRTDGEGLVRSAAPVGVEPGSRGVLVEASLRLPASGRVGLFCRADSELQRGYGVLVDADGSYELVRIEGGAPTPLDAGVFPGPAVPDDPDELVLLRLICGADEAGQPIDLAATLNASQLVSTTDDEALPSGPRSGVGLLVAGDPGTVEVDGFALSLAVAEDRS